MRIKKFAIKSVDLILKVFQSCFDILLLPVKLVVGLPMRMFYMLGPKKRIKQDKNPKEFGTSNQPGDKEKDVDTFRVKIVNATRDTMDGLEKKGHDFPNSMFSI